jgi:hypothetical protein
LGESRSISHSELGQDFAIDIYAADPQAVHELAIGKPVQSSGGTDALDPKPPELPLARPPIAIGVAVGAIGRFLRRLVQLAFREKEAFRPAQVLFATRTALGATFYSSHFSFLLRGDGSSPHASDAPIS